MVLEKSLPDLGFSGDDHDFCLIRHQTNPFNNQTIGERQHSIPEASGILIQITEFEMILILIF